MRHAFMRKMMEFAAADPKVMLLTADLGYHCVEKYAARFPGQFLNTGICEQSMAGIAAGMALAGHKVFCYSIGNFPTLRCLEQLRNDVCYHGLPVVIATNGGGMAYGYLGMSHHATEDLSILRALPEMKVGAPADPGEVEAVMNYLFRAEGPGFLRMNRGGEKVLRGPVPALEKPEFLPLGPCDEAEILLCAAGEIGQLLPSLCETLRGAGISCCAFTVPLLKPFPVLPERFFAPRTRLIVTVEENNILGGLGGAMAEVLSASPAHPALLRLGLGDVYPAVVGKQDYLREVYGLSVARMTEKILAKYRSLN